jgi:hypothetical protein
MPPLCGFHSLTFQTWAWRVIDCVIELRIAVSGCVDLNSISLPGFRLVVGSQSICGHIYESYPEA